MRLLTRLRRDDRGASLVLVAISLLVLLGFAAVAIDGGLAFLDVRGSTNAADDAAMAAALQECNPDTSDEDPEERALAVAAENGYADGVAYSFEDGVHTVVITTASGGALGPATNVAPDSLEVVARSSATCEGNPFLGGYAIFGETSSCTGFDVDLTGSDIVITGGIHSNNDVKIKPSGSGGVINGPITYVEPGTTNISNITGDYTIATTGVQPYPDPLGGLVPADVTGSAAVLHSFSGTAGGDDIEAATLGDVSGSELTIEEPGVYYSSGSWKINKTLVLTGDAATQGVTFVAEGSIDIGSAENLTAYWGRDGGSSGNTDLGPGLLLFAWGDGPPSACNANDIKISGSSVTWEGIMYAPHGEAQASASNNSSVDGSIVAHKVNLSGSGMSVNYETDPDFDPQFQLDLLGTD